MTTTYELQTAKGGVVNTFDKFADAVRAATTHTDRTLQVWANSTNGGKAELVYKIISAGADGTARIRGQHSGAAVPLDSAIIMGPVMPNVKLKYLDDPMLGPPAYKRSRRIFEESDGNCNTCVNFVRAAHAKNTSGLTPGTCPHVPPPTTNDLIYNRTGDMFWIYPSDWMGMSCHQQRT